MRADRSLVHFSMVAVLGAANLAQATTPEICVSEPGYGEICQGTAVKLLDGGTLTGQTPCCEGSCVWQETNGSVSVNPFYLCCGMDGDPTYPGQMGTCPTGNFFTGGLGCLVYKYALQNSFCCSGQTYPDSGTCACLNNGTVVNQETPYACCSDLNGDGPHGGYQCAPAPRDHACQATRGCTGTDICYMGYCRSSTFCWNALVPGSNCTTAPCCPGDFCASIVPDGGTNECEVNPPVCLTQGATCSAAYSSGVETCCVQDPVTHNYLGCDPLTNTCVKAAVLGNACHPDNDGLGSTHQDNCQQGQVCYINNNNGGAPECVLPMAGNCCVYPTVQCANGLDCANTIASPHGAPSDGGSGCDGYQWDNPYNLNCCIGNGSYGLSSICDTGHPYQCCSGVCEPNLMDGVDRCDGLGPP